MEQSFLKSNHASCLARPHHQPPSPAPHYALSYNRSTTVGLIVAGENTREDGRRVARFDSSQAMPAAGTDVCFDCTSYPWLPYLPARSAASIIRWPAQPCAIGPVACRQNAKRTAEAWECRVKIGCKGEWERIGGEMVGQVDARPSKMHPAIADGDVWC